MAEGFALCNVCRIKKCFLITDLFDMILKQNVSKPPHTYFQILRLFALCFLLHLRINVEIIEVNDMDIFKEVI